MGKIIMLELIGAGVMLLIGFIVMYLLALLVVTIIMSLLSFLMDMFGL